MGIKGIPKLVKIDQCPSQYIADDRSKDSLWFYRKAAALEKLKLHGNTVLILI